MSNRKRQALPFLFRCLALCAILRPNIGFPQQLEPLSVENAVNMRSFGTKPPLVFSRDGKWAAYTVLDSQRAKAERPDSYVRTGVPPRAEGDVWISNTETEQARNLTGGTGSNWKPSWSPNGRYLAFLSDRDSSGQANLWIWDSVKDDLKMPSGLPVRAGFGIEIGWMRDSRKLLITTVPEGLSLDDYVEAVWAHPAAAQSETRAGPGSTVVLYEAGRRVDGATITSGTPTFNLDEVYLHDLTSIDVASGKADLLVRGRRIERYFLSPDGSRVAFVVPRRFYRAGSYRRYCDLVILNLQTMRERILASDILLNTVISWSPDSTLLAYATYGADDRSYEFYVAPAGGGSLRRMAAMPHETSDGLWLSPVWDTKGDRVYFILDGALWSTSVSRGGSVELCRLANRTIKYVLSQREGQLWMPDGNNSVIVVAHDDEGKQDGFYRVDLATGRATTLRVGQCYSCGWRVNSTDFTVVSEDGQRVAYVAEDAQHPPELWVSAPDFRNPRQLTHLNPGLEKYTLGSARLIDWLSGDGERLHGALLLPRDYQTGKKYPLIVWVYPGADLSNDFDWFGVGTYPGPLNMQLFATRGYAVLFPDERENVGDRIAGLVKSVLPGVNKAIEMGIADPQRVGVMGHSQGAFATLGLVVATNRFKAAMAADGWADSAAFYGVLNPDGSGSQNGQAERQLGGPPWQYPVTYIQNSPMYYLDRLETPLLLVHGSEDDALPSYLSDEVFVGLHRLAKNVEYAKYEGESHVPGDWSHANQIDLGNRVIAWFDKYLKEDSDPTGTSRAVQWAH